MLEIFLGALSKFFTLECMFSLVIGVVGGMVFGALPGLSAIMAVSLLLPLTFKMESAAALVMLVAVYTSAIYGGSVTACLINTPGTPSSAATSLDGFPLTKQGQGLKAVGVATIASMFGGAFSAIALFFIAPQLARVSLMFSALEYFLVACLGLTVIASVAGEDPIKGLMSGVFGAMLGVVGADIFTGERRYTFGMIELDPGIPMVAAMIGMFAIAQVISSLEDIRKGKTTIVEGGIESLFRGSPIPSKDEFKEIAPTIGISSVLGVLIGILPGAGCDIGSWVSYNTAKKRSKHPERFGHGSLEGIAASETANNAVTGGALIPLMTLGIPGSGTTAVMLGGMMVHGLIPGYDLFTKQGDITYCIILGFFFANLLMAVTGLFIAKPIARVSTMPKAILCPIIIAFCVIGSFAIQYLMLDVYIMVAFSLFGYIAIKLGFAPAPMVLGLLLGPMAERNWRQVIVLCRGDLFGYFLSRPISIVLAVVVVIGLFSPVFMRLFMNRAMGDVNPDTVTAEQED